MTGGSWRSTTKIELAGRKLPLNSATPATVSDVQSAVQYLGFGTGSGYASVQVSLHRSLLPGQSETWNLYDGSLLDVFGDAAPFRVLRGFAFWVSDGGDTAGVSIAGGASNPHTLFFTGTTPGQTCYPGGPAAAGGGAAGVAVTSSACNVKVTNNSAVVATYELILTGSNVTTGNPVGLLLATTYP